MPVQYSSDILLNTTYSFNRFYIILVQCTLILHRIRDNHFGLRRSLITHRFRFKTDLVCMQQRNCMFVLSFAVGEFIFDKLSKFKILNEQIR